MQKGRKFFIEYQSIFILSMKKPEIRLFFILILIKDTWAHHSGFYMIIVYEPMPR